MRVGIHGARYSQPTSIVCLIYLIATCLLPLPFGLEAKWSAYIYCFISFTFLSVLLLLDNAQLSATITRSVIVPFFVFLGFVLLQTLPLPISVISIISPEKKDVLLHNGQLNQVSYSTISLALGITLEKIILSGAYVATLYIGLITGRSRSNLLLVLRVIFVSGVLYSILSFYLFLEDVELLPKIYSDGHFTRLTGTFSNPNVFSSYLVYSFVIGLVLFLYRDKKNPNISILSRFITPVVNGQIFYFIGIIIIFLTMIFSFSRGSILSVFAGICVAYIFIKNVRYKPNLSIFYSMLLVVFIPCILICLLMLSGYIENIGGERLLQWKIMFEMIKDYPLVGVGLGAFEWVFSSYQDGTLRSLHYSYGHSDILQLLVEVGVIGVGILAFIIYGVLKSLSIALTGKYGTLYKNLVIGVIIIIIIQIMHASFDFIFQIPAVTATLFYIIGLGLSPINSILLRNEAST